MLRLCEVHEPLEAALGVLHNPVEGITSADTSFGIVQVEVRVVLELNSEIPGKLCRLHRGLTISTQ